MAKFGAPPNGRAEIASITIDDECLRRALEVIGVESSGALEPLRVAVSEALEMAGGVSAPRGRGRPRSAVKTLVRNVAEWHFIRWKRQLPTVNKWPTKDGDEDRRGPWPDFLFFVMRAAGIDCSTHDVEPARGM